MRLLDTVLEIRPEDIAGLSSEQQKRYQQTKDWVAATSGMMLLGLAADALGIERGEALVYGSALPMWLSGAALVTHTTMMRVDRDV